MAATATHMREIDGRVQVGKLDFNGPTLAKAVFRTEVKPLNGEAKTIVRLVRIKS